MTYAYGMKGAPAVGNGLGGLPRRLAEPAADNAAPEFFSYQFSRIATPGSGVLEPPEGARFMRVTVIGGGGSDGGGGGGCASTLDFFPAEAVTYTVGSHGEDSSASYGEITLTASGGQSNGGAGGTGSGGDISYTGGTGGADSGSGAGGAGPNGNGGDGRNYNETNQNGWPGQFDGNGHGPGGGGGGAAVSGSLFTGGSGAGADGGENPNQDPLGGEGQGGVKVTFIEVNKEIVTTAFFLLWGGEGRGASPYRGGEMGGGGGYGSDGGSGGLAVEWIVYK